MPGRIPVAAMKRVAENFRRMQGRSEHPPKPRRARRQLVASLLIGLAAAGIAAEADARAPIACGSAHVIGRGDTLFKIAKRAYADGWKYKQIFSANQGFLPNAGAVEVGDQILVPCLDGTGPQTRKDAIAQGLIVDADQEEPAPTEQSAEAVVLTGEKDPAADLRQTTAEANEAIEAPGQAVASPGPEAAAAADVVAEAPSACASVHVVGPGDTLFEIAKRAYADGWKYKQIFSANRDFLPNAGAVEVGDQILVPCLDGTGPQTRKDAVAQGLIVDAAQEEPAPTDQSRVADADQEEAVPTEQSRVADAAQEEAVPTEQSLVADARLQEPVLTEQALQPAPLTEEKHPAGELLKAAAQVIEVFGMPGHAVASPGPMAGAALRTIEGTDQAIAGTPEFQLPIPEHVRFLTGSGFAPYADESLPQGGMVPHLASQTISGIAPELPYRVAFVNDWSSHLDVLLPVDAFDVSFPWYKPDCSKRDGLGEEARRLCADFAFSDAFVEVPFGYYTLAGTPLVGATDHAGLLGTRLCRPKGPFPFELDENGLAEPKVSLQIADDAKDCLLRLVRNEVDVVALPRPDAEAAIGRLGLAEVAAEIEALRSTQTLHAVVLSSNPTARSILQLLNQGLAAFMASGKWFETVALHQGMRIASSE